MSATAFSQPNATTFTPEDIVLAVQEGRVRVPSFQRKLRWQWEDVRRLFDSIAKGYPIGSLLLWERNAEEEQIQIGALNIDAPEGRALFVVDGQQRVTSIANVLKDDGARDVRFSLAYNIREGKFEKYEIGSPSHLVPLPVIFDLQRLLAWFATYHEVNEKVLFERATSLAKTIRQYVIPAYVVKQQDEQVLRDIFDRMNNYGRRLSRAEVFSALHGGTAKEGSNLRFSDIAETIDAETGFGIIDDDTVLRAFLARRSADVSREIRDEFIDVNSRDFSNETRETAYRESSNALLRAVRFVQESVGVPHFSFLPYRYLIVVLTRFFAHYPKPSTRNTALLRRFFWRSALAGPYLFNGGTEAMRALAACVVADAESASVQRLLLPFREQKFAPPSLTKFRTKAAGTRVFLCALWSLRPMSPLHGTFYDIDALGTTLTSQNQATNAVGTFFPRAPAQIRQGAANRVILLDQEDNDPTSAFDKTSDFYAKDRGRILASHALDKRLLAHLKDHNAEEFLKLRQAKLQILVSDFIKKMAEMDFEDTPPIDEFNLDDEEEESRDDEPEEG